MSARRRAAPHQPAHAQGSCRERTAPRCAALTRHAATAFSALTLKTKRSEPRSIASVVAPPMTGQDRKNLIARLEVRRRPVVVGLDPPRLTDRSRVDEKAGSCIRGRHGDAAVGQCCWFLGLRTRSLDAVAHGECEDDCDEEPPTDRHRVRQVEDAPDDPAKLGGYGEGWLEDEARDGATWLREEVPRARTNCSERAVGDDVDDELDRGDGEERRGRDFSHWHLSVPGHARPVPLGQCSSHSRWLSDEDNAHKTFRGGMEACAGSGDKARVVAERVGEGR